MKELRGAGVALVTPFNTDGTIDFDGLSKLVQHAIKGGLDYLVVLGTTGEPATMTMQERDQVLAHIKQENKGQLPLVLGIGGNNTAALVNEFERVDLNGISAILSASPYYNKPSQEGIYQHYKTLAAVSPLPIILYNVPGRTASNMTAETTLRLARDVENIVAIKEASGDLIQVMDIVREKPEDFMVISGEDALNFPIMACGGEGIISVLANSQPALCANTVRAALDGKWEEAKALHYKSIDFTNLLFAEGNPAGVKAALQIQGVCGNQVRLPLIKATEDLEHKLSNSLAAL